MLRLWLRRCTIASAIAIWGTTANAAILDCVATDWTAGYTDTDWVAKHVAGLYKIDPERSPPDMNVWLKWDTDRGTWVGFGCQHPSMWRCEVTPRFYRRTELEKSGPESTLTIDRQSGVIVYDNNYPEDVNFRVRGQCKIGVEPETAAPKF